MSEVWRHKTYYPPRVLIETERILDTEFDDAILCVSGAQLEMLRNLTQYLHRRSTFAQGYTKAYYLAPSNDDWDIISSIVADLEEVLMGCNIEGLITAIENQTIVLDAMRQCICAIENWSEKQTGALPDLAGYVTNNDVTYLPPSEAEGTFTPPPTDIVRCEYAQSIYLWCYQLYTEQLLPFANTTADSLTALIVASATFGALAGFVGIPVATLAGIAAALVAWAIEGSIEDFRNWMLGAKNEIVCILYNNLPDTSAAGAALAEYIDSVGSLSLLDKVVLKSVLASSWHYTWIIKDQEENSTWDAYFEDGYCDACETPPAGCLWFEHCDLGDWDGGTVECVAGRAVVKGGISGYLKNSQICPDAPATITLWWTPRAVANPTAQCKFGVRKVGDETWYDVCTSGEKDVDILTSDACVLPGALSGYEVECCIRQISHWCEPYYWCLSTPP